MLLGQLNTASCVVLAEPNYILKTDTTTDRSNPSDFYFQTDFWPFSPYTDTPTGLFHMLASSWETCVRSYGTYEDPTAIDTHHIRDQWHLEMTQTNLAWNIEDGGDGSVKVAIIDSGVDWRHPDLGPNIWVNLGEDYAGANNEIIFPESADPYAPWTIDEWDPNGIDEDGDGYVDNLIGWRVHDEGWYGPPSVPMWDPNHGHCDVNYDPYGNGRHGWQGPHGTQMASIICAAHNGFGCVGMIPKVSLIPINAGLYIEGDDPWAHGIAINEIIEGLDFAMAMDVDIINISLSYHEQQDHDESLILKAKMEETAAAGIIICNSAGNDNWEYTHWPTAWDCVLGCAVVGPDSVKAMQSCYNSYIDFCAPSGEYDDSNPPDISTLGDEFMQAVYYTDPEPYWPDHTPPHTYNGGNPVSSGSVHTYKWQNGDTSGGAAQLSGAFALLKAHYPNHTRQQLIDEMIRGAVDISSKQPQGAPWEGKLGHGLINPYRSLTEWGGPRPGENNIVWSDSVYVSGDYNAPSYTTITIMPGTKVRFANFDNENPASRDEITFNVYNLVALGTEANPIVFETFGAEADDPGHWTLIAQCNGGGAIQMKHCTFKGLTYVNLNGSAYAADSCYVRDCEFYETPGWSTPVVSASDIDFRSCVFSKSWCLMAGGGVHAEWCKWEREPDETESLPAFYMLGGSGEWNSLENSIIRDSEVGIRVNSIADSLFISNVLVEHEYQAGVQSRGDLGIDVQGGFVRSENLSLAGYTVGVNTDGSGKFSAEYSSFTDCHTAALNNDGVYTMFFGYYVQPGSPLNKGGNNVFDDNESRNIVNLDPTGTISARKNWWGSPYGPQGKVNRGNVDVLYHLTSDPNLPPPPDFALLADETSPPFSVGRNFPNPFNPATRFELVVPKGGGRLEANIYDIRGRLVRHLYDRHANGGPLELEFDGRDDAGHALSSGMYLCRFRYGDREEIVKATLVK